MTDCYYRKRNVAPKTAIVSPSSLTPPTFFVFSLGGLVAPNCTLSLNSCSVKQRDKEKANARERKSKPHQSSWHFPFLLSVLTASLLCPGGETDSRSNVAWNAKCWKSSSGSPANGSLWAWCWWRARSIKNLCSKQIHLSVLIKNNTNFNCSLNVWLVVSFWAFPNLKNLF